MKILEVTTIDHITDCGECFYAWEGKCEKTGSKLEDYWKGVLPDCPLEDVVDE